MTYKTESELIETVRSECGSSNWRLGEQAALWKEKWGSSKTDEDFCRMVGGEAFALTPDRVGRCRRVWQQFGKTHGQYRGLTWSHFDKARTLREVNQTEALVWAEENQATVGEMLAWMRATFGEGPETRDEGEEPEERGEPEPVKAVKVKAGAVVKARGSDGAAAGDRIETRDEKGEPEEEESGEVEADHPMRLLEDADHESSAISCQLSAPDGQRGIVSNLIRCLKLEEQTLRRVWPTLTTDERKAVAAVLELLVEFLTLEAVG